MEKFPQQPDPEIAKKSKEAIEVAIGYMKLWDQLANGEQLPPPTDDPEQAQVYIEKMEELKKVFAERYAGEEKERVYAQVDAYIEKLKAVK